MKYDDHVEEVEGLKAYIKELKDEIKGDVISYTLHCHSCTKRDNEIKEQKQQIYDLQKQLIALYKRGEQ